MVLSEKRIQEIEQHIGSITSPVSVVDQIILDLAEESAELREALYPFALFGRNYLGRDDVMEPILRRGRQVLTVMALQNAADVLGMKKTDVAGGDEEEPCADVDRLSRGLRAIMLACREPYRNGRPPVALDQVDACCERLLNGGRVAYGGKDES